MEPIQQRPRLDYNDPASSFCGNRYHGMDVIFIVCLKACIEVLLYVHFVWSNSSSVYSTTCVYVSGADGVGSSLYSHDYYGPAVRNQYFYVSGFHAMLAYC